MNKFKKDYSLLNGKGEWIEDEHPRDEKGRFTDKESSNRYCVNLIIKFDF